MNRIILHFTLLISVFVLNKAYAQNDVLADDKLPQTSSGYFAINGGMGKALGDFADSDIGGASGGSVIQLSFGVPFMNSHLGVAGKTNYADYNMSSQPLFAQQLALRKQFGLDSNIAFNESYDQQIKQISFLAGAFATFPLTGSLSIDTRAVFGPTRLYRPALEIIVVDGDENLIDVYNQSASATITFAYDFGLSVRLNILESQKMCIMASFDYSLTESNFLVHSNSLYIDDSDMLRDGPHEERINDKYSYYDITFGIGYVW